MKYYLTIESESHEDIKNALQAFMNLTCVIMDPEANKSEFAPQPVDARIQYHTCEQCGLNFKPLRKDSRFCSKRCYMQNYMKTYKPKEKLSGEELDKKAKKILAKIRKEIPIREVKRPTTYHESL